MKYLIQYGVGGGFNDTDNYEVVNCDSQKEADQFAYEQAVECFDSYSLDQYGIDEDAGEEEIAEERESWMEYSAEKYIPKKHKKLLELKP